MKKLAFVFGCVVALAACKHGSGVVKTETRNVGDFDGVEIDNGITADVRVGEAGPIEIEADADDLPNIVTEVEGHHLSVRFKGGIHLGVSRGVHVKIPAKDVASMKTSSGATLELAGFKDDACEVEARSGSTIHASGNAKKLAVSATSGSTIDLGALATNDATVNASSGSTIHLRANGSVTGAASSGATVDVEGSPSAREVATRSGATVHYR